MRRPKSLYGALGVATICLAAPPLAVSGFQAHRSLSQLQARVQSNNLMTLVALGVEQRASQCIQNDPTSEKCLDALGTVLSAEKILATDYSAACKSVTINIWTSAAVATCLKTSVDRVSDYAGALMLYGTMQARQIHLLNDIAHDSQPSCPPPSTRVVPPQKTPI